MCKIRKQEKRPQQSGQACADTCHISRARTGQSLMLMTSAPSKLLASFNLSGQLQTAIRHDGEV